MGHGDLRSSQGLFRLESRIKVSLGLVQDIGSFWEALHLIRKRTAIVRMSELCMIFYMYFEERRVNLVNLYTVCSAYLF